MFYITKNILYFMGDKKVFFTAVSVLVGTCIGAGFLGIPYVASRAGFFSALFYIVVFGLIMLLINIYLGEISLRTKGEHQLAGYSRRYLGKKGFYIMEFATIFGIYSAIIAYTMGVGESLSFLFFKNLEHTTIFGIFFAAIMSGLIWRGIRGLKKFEKIGVSIVLLLFLAIFFKFIWEVNVSNLNYFNSENIFLPFGVVLFSMLCFSAIPIAKRILHGKEKLLKRVLITAAFIPIIAYSLFTLVIVGLKGSETPEIATLALGAIFIVLGMFSMFTAYLALGNALLENMMLDKKLKKKNAWFVTSVIPIVIFFIIRIFDISFVKILSVGGVVSGGLVAISVLFMIKKAKESGDRKPEYSVPVNWFVVGILSLIFIAGIVAEIL